MTSEEFTTTVIAASDGMFLTQSADVEAGQRVVATRVALGRNDSAENWREIDSAQAEAYRKEADAAREEAIAKARAEAENAAATPAPEAQQQP